MSLSKEWEEQHLTEKGWVQGNIRYDHAFDKNETPKGVFLTVRKESYIGAIGADVNETFSEKTHINNPDKIKELKSKYGEPDFGV
ncbi:hypothetical protein GCM10022421_16240 [Oceanisphaera sediminis]|uniref:Uncharacterized protein n=1 Tax=Oceanisphaera sediminis TaxID=981381 RepID=A0ABP7DUQ9_9GAMM